MVKKELDVMFSSKTVVWETPQNLYEELNNVFHFTTDVCALPENAKCENYYSPEQDGLAQDWRGDCCWMNPPYGREISKWMKKAYESSLDGATVVCLIPARTDTRWWHDYVGKAAHIEFLKGRLKFGNSKDSAPFPSALVVFGGEEKLKAVLENKYALLNHKFEGRSMVLVPVRFNKSAPVMNRVNKQPISRPSKILAMNCDCISGAQAHIADATVALIVTDPPFGIGEGKFEKLYNRKEANVATGYVEAPEDYDKWTLDWMKEAKRILKPNGSMYVISGWTNLYSILDAARKLDLSLVNHIVWKFNFGVHTKKKFVSSHYHILYFCKRNGKPIFNNHCRYLPDEKLENGNSVLYQDMQDVWEIPKEYARGKVKNCNKLPEALAEKIIEYSSAPGDTVCDFFLGNFTTATVARKLGRDLIGFELNKDIYDCKISDFIDDLVA